MLTKVLPKNEKTRKDWTLAADALFGQNTVVIEILNSNARATAAAALVGTRRKVSGEHTMVRIQIIRENDQPARAIICKRITHARKHAVNPTCNSQST